MFKTPILEKLCQLSFCFLWRLVFYSPFVKSHGHSSGNSQALFEGLLKSAQQLRKVTYPSPLEKVYISFGQESIPVDSTSLYHLVQASAELFLSESEFHCHHCSAHQDEELRQEARKILTKNGFQDLYHKTLETLKKAEIQSLRLVGWAGEKVVHLGVVYVVYSAITEAIESTLMGPAHWACTFFQMGYWPVAIYTNSTWAMLSAEGTDINFWKRVKLSHMAYVYDFRFRLALSKVLVTDSEELKKLKWSDFKKLLKVPGPQWDQHRIHDQAKVLQQFHGIKEQGLWAEFLSRSLEHQNPSTNLPWWVPYDRVTQNLPETILNHELTQIFNGDLAPELRFFMAAKHNQGLRLLLQLLSQSLEESFQHGELGRLDFLKMKFQIGRLASKMDRFKARLFLYALVPTEEIDRDWQLRMSQEKDRMKVELSYFLDALQEGLHFLKVHGHSENGPPRRSTEGFKTAATRPMATVQLSTKCLNIFKKIATL